MINVNQKNVLQIYDIINITNENYLNIIEIGINDIVNWFNEYWISTFSRLVAEEMKKILDEYCLNTSNIFMDLNNTIKSKIILNNQNPDMPKITYKDFKIDSPDTDSLNNLNYKLLDNKVGSKDSSMDLTIPLNKLESIIEQSSTIMIASIVQLDIIEYREKEDIQKNIYQYEKRAKNNIEELKIIIRNRY